MEGFTLYCDCISFTQTYLVTGGYNSVSGEFDSTELLHKDASQWVSSKPLPSARERLRGATLGNKLIMTGEMINDGVQVFNIYWQLLGGQTGGNSLDEILEWDATNEEWKQMGNMKQPRRDHGMAVVDLGSRGC